MYGSCSPVPGRSCFGDLPGDGIVVSPPPSIVETLGTGPVNLKVVPNECCLGRSPWTKNIFASHSHTHYWYKVGMLKVQSIKAAEEWISMEDDQEAVEAIRLDCQYELTGEAADDGEWGGGESSKSDGSKHQDSRDTDDDQGLGDTEGPETLEDLPLMPYAEIAESFSILEAAAEKYRISQATYFLFDSHLLPIFYASWLSVEAS